MTSQVAIDQVTYDAMIYRGSRQASEMGLMTVTALADWRGPPNPHITANGPANGTQVSYYEGTQGQAVGVPAPTPCKRCTLQFWRDGRPRPRAGTFHTCKIVPGQQTNGKPFLKGGCCCCHHDHKNCSLRGRINSTLRPETSLTV